MSRPAHFTKSALEPYCIGMKLRALRNKKGLTLSRLAAETGLSTALLSKLETERMVPTLTTLATISSVYGVSLSYFFSETRHHTLAITRKAHIENAGVRVEAPRMLPLHASEGSPGLFANVIEVPFASSTPVDPGASLCAFIYVLKGRLELMADGMAQHIGQGDCAYIDSQMPMAWRSGESTGPCRILMVQPGRRAE